MARRRDPTVKSLLKALKIDPVREIAQHALTLEVGSKERLEVMWELLPWVHYKPTAPRDLPPDAKSITIIEIGGEG